MGKTDDASVEVYTDVESEYEDVVFENTINKRASDMFDNKYKANCRLKDSEVKKRSYILGVVDGSSEIKRRALVAFLQMRMFQLTVVSGQDCLNDDAFEILVRDASDFYCRMTDGMSMDNNEESNLFDAVVGDFILNNNIIQL